LCPVRREITIDMRDNESCWKTDVRRISVNRIYGLRKLLMAYIFFFFNLAVNKDNNSNFSRNVDIVEIKSLLCI